MKKQKLSREEVESWQKKQWNLYASSMGNYDSLRFWINAAGEFRLMCGADILYTGMDLDKAISVWEEAWK